MDSNGDKIVSAVMQEARAAKVEAMLSEIKALDAETIAAVKNALYCICDEESVKDKNNENKNKNTNTEYHHQKSIARDAKEEVGR